MPVRPSVSELTSHLGYWLRHVSNHVSLAFARKLEGRGVTVAEWVVLRELHGADALAPSRMAQRLGMTRGAITKLADRLIAKALVVRKADPADRRAQTLALTDKGRRLVPELAALADANDAEFFDVLAVKDRDALLRILKNVARRRKMTGVPVD